MALPGRCRGCAHRSRMRRSTRSFACTCRAEHRRGRGQQRALYRMRRRCRPGLFNRDAHLARPHRPWRGDLGRRGRHDGALDHRGWSRHGRTRRWPHRGARRDCSGTRWCRLGIRFARGRCNARCIRCGHRRCKRRAHRRGRRRHRCRRHRFVRPWRCLAIVRQRHDRRALQRFEQGRQTRRQRRPGAGGLAADGPCRQPVQEIAHGAHSSR